MSRVVLGGLIGAVLGLIGWSIGTAGGATLPLALWVVGPAVVLMLLRLVTATVAETAELPPLPVHPAAENGRAFSELRQLERRLEAAVGDGSRFERNVRPVLLLVMTDRLRWTHGIDLRREPTRARQLVGEELWMLTTPIVTEVGRRTPGPSRAQLTSWINQLEGL